jgi:hypothetical protein
MTEIPPAEPRIWSISEEARDEERVQDQRALARARYQREGWVKFSAIMLTVLGSFQIVNGLTAIFRSGTYTVGEDRLVVEVDYTVWGWVHLILGVVAVAAGFGLVKGQAWARFAGIGIALLSSVANLAFIPAAPVAATLVIVLDVVVIYGIVVYGKDIPEGSGY